MTRVWVLTTFDDGNRWDNVEAVFSTAENAQAAVDKVAANPSVHRCSPLVVDFEVDAWKGVDRNDP